MGKKWLIDLANVILKEIDPSYVPTNDVPDLILEAIKDVLPELLALLSALKISAK